MQKMIDKFHGKGAYDDDFIALLSEKTYWGENFEVLIFQTTLPPKVCHLAFGMNEDGARALFSLVKATRSIDFFLIEDYAPGDCRDVDREVEKK